MGLLQQQVPLFGGQETVMAIAQINVSDYLALARAFQKVEKRACWLAFDAEADVLYVNFHQPAKAATDTEVTDDDLVIRYDGEEIIGLTILSVSQR